MTILINDCDSRAALIPFVDLSQRIVGQFSICRDNGTKRTLIYIYIYIYIYFDAVHVRFLRAEQASRVLNNPSLQLVRFYGFGRYNDNYIINKHSASRPL